MKTDEKQETIKQWNNDPCGAVAADGIEVGSRAFYERIDENRYGEYAPWMKRVMGFGDFAGKKVLEIGFGMGTDLFQFASGGAGRWPPRHTTTGARSPAASTSGTEVEGSGATTIPPS